MVDAVGANICDAFDYPGGLQSLWCHRPEELTFRALGDLAASVFLSGPHSATELTESARHLQPRNPAFVHLHAER